MSRPSIGAPSPDAELATDHLTHDLSRRSRRGGAVLLSAQMVRVLAQMATLVVLARLLPPSAFGLLAIVLTALVTGDWRASPGYLPWAVAAGLSGAVGLVAYYAALSSGTMGVVAPMRCTSVGELVVVCAAAISRSPYAIVFRLSLKTNAMTCATAAYRFGGIA